MSGMNPINNRPCLQSLAAAVMMRANISLKHRIRGTCCLLVFLPFVRRFVRYL